MNALKLLQNYLRINTGYPQPDYTAAVALLASAAQQAGLGCTLLELPSGYPVLIITCHGTDTTLPALAFNHHMDVVPVCDEEQWQHKPFGGQIQDAIIYGRGVQDMKGVGIAQLASVINLKQKGVELVRTVHLICVPDEERGGFLGAAQFVQHPAFAALNIGFVLDEGLASGTPAALFIKTTERKPLQIEVVARGATGHAAFLHTPNRLHELIQFCSTIVAMHEEQKKRVEPAGLCLSAHITSITAPSSITTIPALATAIIDIRIPPTMQSVDVRNLLEQSIARFSSLSYRVIASVPDNDSANVENSDLYASVKRSIVQSGFNAEPLFFEASTDLRWYRALGIEGLGLTPFTCAPNLHGTNESLPVADLERGVMIFEQILLNFCRGVV